MNKIPKTDQARILVRKHVRDEIKILAAKEKMTMYDFIEKMVREYKKK